MKQSIYLIVFSLFFLASCKKENAAKDSSKSQEKPSTKAENVSMLDQKFNVVNLKGEAVARAIWLYLPPNYDSSEERYPVIYMHDGQNLFDAKTSYAGEWGVDEILNDLYTKTKKGFIVVGINNVGAERMNEYSPWKHDKYGGGSGDRYVKMIVEELKPYIDKNYRTKPEAEFTGIIGSSMGGLISYYAGLAYPDVFGRLGVVSPSFWFSKEILDFTKNNPALSNTKMYLLLGDKEGMTKEFNEVSKLLVDSGFPKDHMQQKLIPGGEHNEAFWNSQFLNVIRFLYDIEL
ncbi:MAG: esterase [Flavobacteriaceae bacterium]|nr:esterase [Flavobacteriaceae bacterium]|tara:strand:- start:350088 stop:350957 length:870 start_codon:yes stop_codon:yes gene_type:complete